MARFRLENEITGIGKRRKRENAKYMRGNVEEMYNLDKREKKLKGGMRLSVRGGRMKK